ncbi:MAG: hydantoinase B/oxoprolinase family protein [Acidimicrobiales bacterium]
MNGAEMNPITFELLRHRLLAINDEATFTIMKVSANQIATDSNDLNSALMTADGEVVVFGVWILVHSCSLNTLVGRIKEQYSENPGINPGDMFMSNDPYITGRHQLDVVVVAPVFHDDRIIAWTGTIVHQNDVGGPVPGGFAVGARSIYEEAIPMAPIKIVESENIRRDVEAEYLIRSRTPELNRLDLLAQIAANRLHGERVLDLCKQYGVDEFTGTLDMLLRSTESRLRRRLTSLPDGRWRNVSYMEHDGVKDDVYRISLVMTKVGGDLELDFRESSDQAQGLVNAPHGTMRCFALVALLALLGFDDLPWIPGAFERVVRFTTRPGTVTHASWPAAVSMSGTGAGQAVRTVVQQCVAAMLDASDEYESKIMTSGMTSAPGVAISGRNLRGEGFSSILVDAQLGGGGARSFADGVDTAGLLHSPGATTSNIELNEQKYPLLYLHRLERADSGGPGMTRGGVGSEHQWILREPSDDMELILFGHGVQQPTATGLRGGEPGSQNAFLFNRGGTADAMRLVEGGIPDGRKEVPPPKLITTIQVGDLFTSWCAGGGGMGDPLDRDPEAVCHDVEEGLVTPQGASRDYGVVVGAEYGRWSVDPRETARRRREMRSHRLGGTEPIDPAPGRLHTGRRVSSTLELVSSASVSSYACRRCGHVLCPSDENVKLSLVMSESPTWERWSLSEDYEGATRFVLRRFFCPTCAVQMFVDVNLRGEEPTWSLEPA